MNQKVNIDNWITYVREEWLLAVGKETSLVHSSEIIVKKMQDAIQEGDSSKVWYLIERLKKICDLQRRGDENNRRVERAETLLECGIAAYKVGDLDEAILLLDESAGGYTSDAHFRAVAIWIRSCIQWLLPSRIENAISGWERSRGLFERLQSQSSSVQAKWYQERIAEMREAIDRATEEDGPLPYEETQNETASRRKRANENHAVLRMYPVYGQIPAGKPLTIDTSTGWLDIDEVVLNDEQYRIGNLRNDEQIIHLQNSYRYYLLEVTGNSMNSATPIPIEDKDFVLLREQNTANNQDIVAVEIVGSDDRATLKRYYEKDGKVFLRPESDDRSFMSIDIERELTDLDNDFFIRGLAIAVFKKIVD